MSRPTFGVFLSLILLTLIWAAPAAPQSGDLSAEKFRVAIAPDDAVTLYGSTGYRGTSETFSRDDRELGNNRIGNDGAVSIRVRRGCRAELFEHYDFEGRSVVVTEDIPDLGHTRLGRNEVSSLKVSCGGSTHDDEGDVNTAADRALGSRRGALVFAESRFHGRFQFFDGPVADLQSEKIGGKSISSVKVADGCRLILFTERDFQGQSMVLTDESTSLRRTELGPDTASSLLVSCVGPRRGVVLFADSQFRGTREPIDRDVARLEKTPLGKNRLGSLLVPPGCQVTLYARPDFQGASLSLDQDTPHLVGQAVGPDSAASIKVSCRGQGGGDGTDDLPYGSGAVLYELSHYSGQGTPVNRDVPDLGRLDDRVSSIRVAPGCEVLLFRDANYRGRGTQIDRDVADLDDVRDIGSDRLSSIRVRCNRWRQQGR